MMEDHDRAYGVWKERHTCGRPLIHIDAHIDFGWIPEIDLDEIDENCAGLMINPYVKPRTKMINIGNYICPAMREGIVSRFYWVVPDRSLRSRRGRKHIIGQLNQLLKVKQYSGPIELQRDRINCRLFGKEVVVCCLDGLERIDAPALLDIDVDFMLTADITDDLNPERFPWIFPDELYERIEKR